MGVPQPGGEITEGQEHGLPALPLPPKVSNATKVDGGGGAK